jgi:transcriptional regulator with XRE-family HTH domain
MIKISFSEKLKTLLEDVRGPISLSKSGVISSGTLTNYLHEKQTPGFEKIGEIADHFQIDAGYFFSEKSLPEYRRHHDSARFNKQFDQLDENTRQVILNLISGYLKHRDMMRAAETDY